MEGLRAGIITQFVLVVPASRDMTAVREVSGLRYQSNDSVKPWSNEGES
jgi:hypothetical protein